jgi:hypothetical protein
MRSSFIVLLLWLGSTLAWTQEDMLHAEFRREGERASDACKDFSFKTVPACAIELFTDHAGAEWIWPGRSVRGR